VSKKSILITSIVVTVIAYLLFQYAIYTVLILCFAICHPTTIFFYLSSALIHAIMLTGLLAMKDRFRVVSTGERLEKINLPNILTMFRISSLPTICFILNLTRLFPLMPFLLVFIVLAFISDLFDGMLSRKSGQVTHIGKILDSSSDYFAIVGLSIAFYVFNFIPLWFFILAMTRLVSHAAIMAFLFYRGTYNSALGTSFLGKATIFSIMVFYAFKIAEALKMPVLGTAPVVGFIKYATAFVILISFIERIVFLLKRLSSASNDDDPSSGSQNSD